MSTGQWNIPGVLAVIERHVDRCLFRSGARTVTDVMQRMSEEKHGRWYLSRGRQRSKIWHHASAPGEAPAVDIGELKRAVAFHVKTQGPIRILAVGVRGSDEVQRRAIRLEFRMNRPAFVPAIETEWPRFLAELAGGEKK